jgi:hypothetical protein
MIAEGKKSTKKLTIPVPAKPEPTHEKKKCSHKLL